MISVLAIGHLVFEQIAALQPLFPSIEAIDSALQRDRELFAHGPELNRAVAAAANPWVLVLREGETVDQALAGEIQRAIAEPAQAWGFRLRIQPMYAGRPLLLGQRVGEIRLVHQRHARIREREWKVEGTVIRLRNPLRRSTFGSPVEHEAFLRARGVPHSPLRRILLFTRNALLSGAWYRSSATLHYLWLEAGYDVSDAGTR